VGCQEYSPELRQQIRDDYGVDVGPETGLDRTQATINPEPLLTKGASSTVMAGFISEVSYFVEALKDAKEKNDRPRLITYLMLFGLKEIGFGSGRSFDSTVSRKLTEKLADQILQSTQDFSEIEVSFDGHGPYRLTDFAAKIGLPALLRITNVICREYKLPYIEISLRQFLEAKRLQGDDLEGQLKLYQRSGVENELFRLPVITTKEGPCTLIGVPESLISAKPSATALKKRKQDLSKTLTKSSSYPKQRADNIIICMENTHFDWIKSHFNDLDYECKLSDGSSQVCWAFYRSKTSESWLLIYCDNMDTYKCASHFARIFGVERLTARTAIIGPFKPNSGLTSACCYVDDVMYLSRKGNHYSLPASPLEGIEKYSGKVYGSTKARRNRFRGNAVISSPAVMIYYFQQYFNRITNDSSSLFRKPFVLLIDANQEEEGLETLVPALIKNMPRSKPTKNIIEKIKELEKETRGEGIIDYESETE
jgi:hypothetical protein